MYIYEKDIQDYFFKKLIAAGLAPEEGDLQVISEIVFDYLIEIGILHPTKIVDEEDLYED